MPGLPCLTLATLAGMLAFSGSAAAATLTNGRPFACTD